MASVSTTTTTTTTTSTAMSTADAAQVDDDVSVDETKEALINRRIEEIRRRNEALLRRHQVSRL